MSARSTTSDLVVDIMDKLKTGDPEVCMLVKARLEALYQCLAKADSQKSKRRKQDCTLVLKQSEGFNDDSRRAMAIFMEKGWLKPRGRVTSQTPESRAKCMKLTVYMATILAKMAGFANRIGRQQKRRLVPLFTIMGDHLEQWKDLADTLHVEIEYEEITTT